MLRTNNTNLAQLAKSFEASELEQRLEYKWGGPVCYKTIEYTNTCTGACMTITEEVPCETLTTQELAEK